MAGTLPHNNFRSVLIKSITPTITTVAVTGQRQSKGLPAHYWQITAEYTSLTRQQFNEVMGFLTKQRGSLYQFNMIIPQLSNPSGEIAKALTANPTRTTLPTTATIYYQGQNIVALNFNSSTGITRTNIVNAGGDPTKAFRPGDFIRFANHSKVYQVIEDANYSGATQIPQVYIYPNLQTNVPSGTQVYYYDVPFEVFNLNDRQEYEYTVGDDNSITLEVQEAL